MHEPAHNTDRVAELEALLFQYGNPVSVKKISALLGEPAASCQVHLQELETRLKERGSGLRIMENNGSVQLATRPDFSSLGERIMKEEIKEELTPAALETLSLVAYLGPVPRSTIDFIRGVNSSFILRNLLIRGLVEREQNPKRRNTYVYRASFAFLEHMGIPKAEDLPEYQKYREILHRFESKAEEEQAQEETVHA